MDSVRPTVSEQAAPTVALVLHRLVSAAPEQFEDVRLESFYGIVRHVAGRTVCLDGAGERLRGASRTWLLTFDDGNASDYECTFPILQEAGIQAVFFLITEKVGTPGYLTWEQAKEMRKYGMEFGSHGRTHAKLTELAPPGVREELVVSREEIQQRLGTAVHAFSFPFGRYDDRLVQFALQAGYSACCVSDHGTVRLPAQLIPRNSINGAMSWPAVRRILEPTGAVRLRWALEDTAKRLAKQAIGEAAYRRLRSLIVGGFRA